MRAGHHVEVIRRVTVRDDHRMIAAGHHHDVAVLDGHRLVERAIVGVDALEREALRRIEAVIIGFFEEALGGNRVGVVLVRRIARRVARRGDDFDDQQRLRGGILRQDVAHVTRVRALPAHGAPHRRRVDPSRRHTPRGGRGAERDLGVRLAGDAHVAPGRKIGGVGRDILERARPLAEPVPGDVAAFHRHASRDDHDAELARTGRPGVGFARREPECLETDIVPTRRLRRHARNGAPGARRLDQQPVVHATPAAARASASDFPATSAERRRYAMSA